MGCAELPGLTIGSMTPLHGFVFAVFGVAFFLAAAIGMMADHRIMAKASITIDTCDASHARIALVVIEAELVFGSLKTVLDRPAMASTRPAFDGCLWAPVVKRRVIIGERRRINRRVSQTVICAVKLRGIEIGKLEIAPIVQPRSLVRPCRQRFQSDERRSRRFRGGARD